MFRNSRSQTTQNDIRAKKKEYLSSKVSFGIIKKVWKYAKPHRYLMGLTFICSPTIFLLI